MLALAIVLGLALAPASVHGQRFTLLHSFIGNPDGANPNGGMIRDSAGNLYGTTAWGGAFNWGTAFKLDKTGKETLPYSFTGATDGAQPFGGPDPGCCRQHLRCFGHGWRSQLHERRREYRMRHRV